METIPITSHDQVPFGLNRLLERIDELEALMNSRTAIQPTQTTNSEKYHTRSETAKILRITLATLHSYTLSKRIVAHRIGNRVLYKENDIQAALRTMNTGKIA